MKVDDVEVMIKYANEGDTPATNSEIMEYINRGRKRFPNTRLESIELDVDGDYVGIYYGIEPKKFDRIRRVTGYLTGTLDRWNDAKRAEEHDRVKHGITRGKYQYQRDMQAFDEQVEQVDK